MIFRQKIEMWKRKSCSDTVTDSDSDIVYTDQRLTVMNQKALDTVTQAYQYHLLLPPPLLPLLNKQPSLVSLLATQPSLIPLQAFMFTTSHPSPFSSSPRSSLLVQLEYQTVYSLLNSSQAYSCPSGTSFPSGLLTLTDFIPSEFRGYVVQSSPSSSLASLLSSL